MAFDHERAVWELNQLLCEMLKQEDKGSVLAENIGDLMLANQKMARVIGRAYALREAARHG